MMSTAAHDTVFIVVPAYNEATVIGDVIRRLRELYAHVVVVDDGSGDDTTPRARRAGATVLRHPINRGQGAALQTGIGYSLARGAECVVTFDGDGQHHAEEVARLLEPILGGEADICLGSRFLGGASGMPISRRILLRAAVIFTWLVSGIHLTDAHNGLRAFSRRAARRIDIRLDRMAHASELLDQVRAMRLPLREVPVSVSYTRYSLAKGQSGAGAVRIACDYLIGRLIG